ncbi:LCP family glycopolymer transferase [Streptomyces sp. NPDC055709]
MDHRRTAADPARQTRNPRYNTNTLILIHVPGDGGKATAFSIPRDDFVDIPSHGKDKVKKAYGLAKARTEESSPVRANETGTRWSERAARPGGGPRSRPYRRSWGCPSTTSRRSTQRASCRSPMHWTACPYA